MSCRTYRVTQAKKKMQRAPAGQPVICTPYIISSAPGNMSNDRGGFRAQGVRLYKTAM